MIKRLFPFRWAVISAWTAAAVGWGVALFGMAEATDTPAAPNSDPPQTPSSTTTAPTPASVVTTTLPTLPDSGLVIIRYTPVPPPPPVEIVRTVRAAPQPGRGSAPAAAPAPAPAPTVKSSGS